MKAADFLRVSDEVAEGLASGRPVELMLRDRPPLPAIFPCLHYPPGLDVPSMAHAVLDALEQELRFGVACQWSEEAA
ncbi:MAG: hypothetical protein ACYDCL_17450 [Myxococcales bacterium]